MQDAYVRLSGQRILHSNVPDSLGSMVFIDLDMPATNAVPGEVPYLSKSIVEVPPGFFLQASEVLLRCPKTDPVDEESLLSQARGLTDLIERRTAHGVRVGFVVLPIGRPPYVVWSDGARDLSEGVSDGDRNLLARARTVELNYLLATGSGIWNPRGYHYVLPSGEHSGIFVRLANAFKRPRDAASVATWLNQELTVDLALVTDSPTLLPLVSAIELTMQRHDLGSPESVMLSDYSTNHFEVERAVAYIAGAGKVLGLVSVSSTGTTARRIAAALQGQSQSYALETLVVRGGTSGMILPPPETSVREPWLQIGSRDDLYPGSGTCDLCRTAERSRVVYIDPRSFEPMVLPQPELMTPALPTPKSDLKDLWQCYDRTKGVGVHASPHSTTRELRSNRPKLAVRCYPNWLVNPDRYGGGLAGVGEVGSYARFIQLVEQRSKIAAENFVEDDAKRRTHNPFDPTEIDLVITTQDDRKEPGFVEFVAAVVRSFGTNVVPEIVPVPRPFSPMNVADNTFEGKTNILVITLGAITGTTMQQLYVGLLSHLGPDNEAPAIAGIVLHARPEDMREWEVLKNAYTRLSALWISPLPLGTPFAEEDEMFNVLKYESDDEVVGRFVEDRISFLNVNEAEWGRRIDREAAVVDPWAVFWGMPLRGSDEPEWIGESRPRLRPSSFYGHRLRAVTTFAAIGSAMQSRRLEKQEKLAPVLLQFEMPAILRSYFDPLIVASVLRWLQPHEAWWGPRPEDATNVLAETFARADDADRKILLPELLLAAALGKVPAEARVWLTAESFHCIWCWENDVPYMKDAGTWTDEDIGPVKVGLALAGKDHEIRTIHANRVEEALGQVGEKIKGDESSTEATKSRSMAHLLGALEWFLGTEET